jgi:hypothetical protein
MERQSEVDICDVSDYDLFSLTPLWVEKINLEAFTFDYSSTQVDGTPNGPNFEQK